MVEKPHKTVWLQKSQFSISALVLGSALARVIKVVNRIGYLKRDQEKSDNTKVTGCFLLNNLETYIQIDFRPLQQITS